MTDPEPDNTEDIFAALGVDDVGESSLVDLPSGEGLTAEEAAVALREAFHSVVLFAGTAKSGKTTLLASLYLLFQKGPFEGYIFAGSNTLVGFESRNYFALCASNGTEPTTPRTSISEYLHLRVRREDLSEPTRDLLLCDLTGEDFREAKDSSEACRRLNIVRRADYFVLLIDGEKLANPAARNRAKNDPSTLLRNCLDTGMLGHDSAVDVLYTKWDKIEARSDKEEIAAFADVVDDEFRRLYAGRVRELRIKRIAAHPFDTPMPLGFGLEEVFPSWVEAGAGARTPVRRPRVEHVRLTEYDRYAGRRLPHLFAQA